MISRLHIGLVAVGSSLVITLWVPYHLDYFWGCAPCTNSSTARDICSSGPISAPINVISPSFHSSSIYPTNRHCYVSYSVIHIPFVSSPSSSSLLLLPPPLPPPPLPPPPLSLQSFLFPLLFLLTISTSPSTDCTFYHILHRAYS